jgi:hypothetical protein
MANSAVDRRKEALLKRVQEALEESVVAPRPSPADILRDTIDSWRRRRIEREADKKAASI